MSPYVTPNKKLTFGGCIMIADNNEHNDYFKDILGNFADDSGLDYGMCEMLIKMYITEAEVLIYKIDSALNIGSYKDAIRLIHNLKGTSANIRATEIASIALLAEQALRQNKIEEVRKLIVELFSLLEKFTK